MEKLMKQLYFSFIHNYLNYENIIWVSTNESNLLSLYCHKKMQLGLFMTRTVLHT